jgi:hypothetical protein
MPLGLVGPTQVKTDVAGRFCGDSILVAEVVPQKAMPDGVILRESTSGNAHALLPCRGFQCCRQRSARGRQGTASEREERFAQAGIGVDQLIFSTCPQLK